MSVFYESRVSETRFFTRVRNHNLLFHHVFLTLEPLNDCVLRGSSFGNTVFYEGRNRNLQFHHVFLTLGIKNPRKTHATQRSDTPPAEVTSPSGQGQK
jgi:hypothetical protein